MILLGKETYSFKLCSGTVWVRYGCGTAWVRYVAVQSGYVMLRYSLGTLCSGTTWVRSVAVQYGYVLLRYSLGTFCSGTAWVRSVAVVWVRCKYRIAAYGSLI